MTLSCEYNKQNEAHGIMMLITSESSSEKQTSTPINQRKGYYLNDSEKNFNVVEEVELEDDMIAEIIEKLNHS